MTDAFDGNLDDIRKVLENLDNRDPPSLAHDIELAGRQLGKTFPSDYKRSLQVFGTGSGFASLSENSEYLHLFSVNTLPENQPDGLPENLIVVGSNGGGEFIVACSDRGYGLLPMISDYSSDFLLVASTFSELLKKAKAGTWFQLD